MKRTFAIAILLATLTLVISCGSPQEIRLDEGDDGRLIELDKGQILVITLVANPTTGYKWEVAKHEEHILVQMGETEFQSESDLTGSSGVEILRFKAANAGMTDIILVYHRLWEKDVEPLETFSLKVVVR